MPAIDGTGETLGELEETLLVNSSRAANFVALLRYDRAIQETIPELVEAYEKFATEDSRGTRLANLAAASHPSEDIALLGSRTSELISHELYPKYLAAIIPEDHSYHPRPSRSVCFAQKIALRGVRYASADVFERDSDVIFHPVGPARGSQTCAGRIDKIFTAPPSMSSDSNAVNVFVVVQPYSPLPTTSNEKTLALDRVCRSFHPVAGYLSSSLRQESCIVRATDIVCHFAKLPLDEVLPDSDVMHVLQLDRVSQYLFECHYTILSFCSVA